MALLKTLTDPRTGAPSSYWRIDPHFTVDASRAATSGWLVGYLDQTARSEGKEPLGLQTFRVTCAVNPSAADQRAVLYAAAKELAEFSDAVDV